MCQKINCFNSLEFKFTLGLFLQQYLTAKMLHFPLHQKELSLCVVCILLMLNFHNIYHIQYVSGMTIIMKSGDSYAASVRLLKEQTSLTCLEQNLN